MISSAIMEQVDVIFLSVVSELFGAEFTVHPEQMEAVFSVLCRKDTVVVFPAGHGALQVLPRFMDRLRRVREPSPRTLMVSSLIALMLDQASGQGRIGVEAGRGYPLPLCEEETEKFIQGKFCFQPVPRHITLPPL